jgi:hypothetical protein
MRRRRLCRSATLRVTIKNTHRKASTEMRPASGMARDHWRRQRRTALCTKARVEQVQHRVLPRAAPRQNGHELALANSNSADQSAIFACGPTLSPTPDCCASEGSTQRRSAFLRSQNHRSAPGAAAHSNDRFHDIHRIKNTPDTRRIVPFRRRAATAPRPAVAVHVRGFAVRGRASRLHALP